MAVDLAELAANEREYLKVVATIEQRYKCRWEDELHDSFRRYVDQEIEMSEGVQGIRTGAEEIDRNIDDLDIDGLLRHSEEISREAETI